MTRTSIIGKATCVIGDISGAGDLEIDGRVQGDVTLDGVLRVLANGTVLGSIRANEVHVHGQVDGDLSARDALVLHAGAAVQGDLSAPRLGIEEGARVRGAVRTTSDEPSFEESSAAMVKVAARPPAQGPASPQAAPSPQAPPSPHRPPSPPRPPSPQAVSAPVDSRNVTERRPAAHPAPAAHAGGPASNARERDERSEDGHEHKRRDRRRRRRGGDSNRENPSVAPSALPGGREQRAEARSGPPAPVVPTLAKGARGHRRPRRDVD